MLAALTGDRALGPIGQHMLGEASAGQKALGDLPDKRAKGQLHIEQMRKLEEARRALQDPATAEALRSALREHLPDVDLSNVPAATLQHILDKMIGPLTAASAKRDVAAQPKFAVNPVTGGLYDTKTGKAVTGAGGAPLVDENERIAAAIISGEQPPELKGLYKRAAPIRAILAREGFNLSTATNDWQATQRHLQTLNGPQQTRLRQAVDATRDQLDNIEQLYNEWQQKGFTTQFKAFNKASLAAAKQLGGDAGAVAQGLEGQIALLTGELGNVLMGGNSPTDHGLKLAGQMLQGDWNEKSFKKAIELLRRDLQIRVNSLKHSAAAGTSTGNPYGAKPPGVPEGGGGGAPGAGGAPIRKFKRGPDGKLVEEKT